ncbi:MAG: NAD(P)/FAD-dependent oxidoreductase [Gaiellaceae bacterium]
MQSLARTRAPTFGASPLALEDGSRVAVIGGGPSGSLFAFFLLGFAQMIDLDLRVDVYEARDFAAVGPRGCNMCAGIVSESLVQMLAIEGINLPTSVVQRGIDAYVVTTQTGQFRLATPTQEQRVATVHRGGGPRDADDARWGGLDGYLLMLARERGANLVRRRVKEVAWQDGRPSIVIDESAETYDLLVGATGVNSGAWQLFEALGLRSARPQTVHAYVTEVHAEPEAIERQFGTAMHLFLLDIPRLDFAAIVPKGDFFTVCLLGREIDHELIDAFFDHQTVRRCFPGLTAGPGHCHCGPKINVREAPLPYMDRLVLVGDCGVTRLYKDGLGAAYRTAKAAASTAAFSGVSASDFRRHYLPVYRALARDNRYGLGLFALMQRTRRLRWLHQAGLAAAAREADGSAARRTSSILWDMFTGSAPYRDIALRAADPRIGLQVGREVARAFGRSMTRTLRLSYGLPRSR